MKAPSWPPATPPDAMPPGLAYRRRPARNRSGGSRTSSPSGTTNIAHTKACNRTDGKHVIPERSLSQDHYSGIWSVDKNLVSAPSPKLRNSRNSKTVYCPRITVPGLPQRVCFRELYNCPSLLDPPCYLLGISRFDLAPLRLGIWHCPGTIIALGHPASKTPAHRPVGHNTTDANDNRNSCSPSHLSRPPLSFRQPS